MKIVAGIDISKATLDVSLNGKAHSFSNDRVGHLRLYKAIKKADLVVMEATGSYHFEVAGFLVEKGMAVSVVNPARAHYYAKSLGHRNKTDKVDAKILVAYGESCELDRFVPLTHAQLSLNRYVRMRQDLVNQRSSVKGRRKEPILMELEKALLEAQEVFLDKQITQIEDAMDCLVNSNPELKANHEHLTSIPGIGKVTAWSIQGEVKDFSRFVKSKQISAFSGICPSVHESGTSIKRPSHISRHGSCALRKCLYMAAVAAIRIPSVFKDFYIRLVSRGKAKKSALVAVMHKLLRVAYAVVTKGCPFNPERALTTT